MAKGRIMKKPKVRTDGHLTGMRGVYLVAAELAGLGFIVSPTSRSAIGADLLVTDRQCKNSYTVQVKTNAKPVGFWLLGAKAASLKSDTLFYVLVNLREEGDHDFYVMPSAHVARQVNSEERRNSTWYAIYRKRVERYWNAWEYFGKP
jgi:hypothetical protein